MPPLPPQHLLPHIIQIMPRNPKYDQFQSKGHHNEEKPQSMTQIPKFDPFHEVKIVPKLEQSTNHNLLSFEDAQEIWACKCQAISSMGSPGNTQKPQIWPISLSKKHAKIISSVDHQDTAACKISGHSCHAFSRKCPETPNFTYFTKSK